MSFNRGSCYNAGAISWVRDIISTTYWVSVLTNAIPNRKVSTSQTAGGVAYGCAADRWNHLSKYPSAILEQAGFLVRSDLRRSVSSLALLRNLGECCA